MLSLLQLKSKTNYVFRVCVCSRRYLAWNAQLSAVACPALLYFSTLLHKRHDFRRKFYWTKMCVLIFCTNFIWNVFHSKNNWAKSDKKKVYTVLHEKFPLFVSYLNETRMVSTDFRTTLKYQISWKSFQGGIRIVPCGQTDRHDEANSRFSQFCESA